MYVFLKLKSYKLFSRKVTTRILKFKCENYFDSVQEDLKLILRVRQLWQLS